MDLKKNRLIRKGLMGLCLLPLGFGNIVQAGDLINRIIATVNQDPITLYDLDTAVTNMIKEYDRLGGNKQGLPSDLRKKALDHLIDESLLNQQVAKEGITITDSELETTINNILKRNTLSQGDLSKELTQKGITLQEYKEDIRGQLRRMRYINQIVGSKVRVSDEEVNAFYQQGLGKVGNAQQIHIAQIVVPIASSSEGDLKKAKGEAEEIYKKAQSGKNFDALIQEAGAEGSGDLGEVSFSGISPQLAQALQNLKEGEVTPPIQTPGGFLIVKLIDKPNSALHGSEDIKANIRDRIYELKVQEEIKKYVDGLKSKAFIDIRS